MKPLPPLNASHLRPRDVRIEFSDRPRFIVADAVKFTELRMAIIEAATLKAARFAIQDGIEI